MHRHNGILRFASTGAPRLRRGAVLLLGLLTLFAGQARGAEIIDLTVFRESGRYHLYATADMRAPREAIFSVLTDYAKYPQMSSLFQEGRLLPVVPGMLPQAYLRVRACVWFFCRTAQFVGTVTMQAPAVIEIQLLPEQSDFRYGHIRWRLFVHGELTRVELEIVVEPDFWIPPLIGPPLVERQLRSDGPEVLQRLEKLAQDLLAQAAMQ